VLVSEPEVAAAATRVFVYLDDAIFAGNRVWSDLEKWVAKRIVSKPERLIIIAPRLEQG
jgi:hypothetical protein